MPRSAISPVKNGVRISWSRLVFGGRSATVRSMLSDRSYMRQEYQRERTSALTWLMCAMIAGFVLQLVLGSPWMQGSAGRFDDMFGLSPTGLRAGRVWTLLTHAFLHSTTFIVHVIFNVLALYFLGRELLPMMGTRRFLGLFVTATTIGGAAWAATHWGVAGEVHLGATAAVEALFIVFACFFPNQQIPFLLFFLFPVTLKPKHVAYALAGSALIGFFCYELPGNTLPFGMELASSAHLGGMLVGFLYYRFVHDGRWFISEDRAEIELPRWLKRAKKSTPAAPQDETTPVAPPSREDIRAEVDRILDKINSEGFGALTANEKRVLDDAKALLSRR